MFVVHNVQIRFTAHVKYECYARKCLVVFQAATNLAQDRSKASTG